MRKPVHIVEAQEPDYEMSSKDDVLKAMLKGHIDLDNERFKNLIADVADIKTKMNLVTYGVFGAVGVALLNLVIKH